VKTWYVLQLKRAGTEEWEDIMSLGSWGNKAARERALLIWRDDKDNRQDRYRMVRRTEEVLNE
jgi:hypothetical protein